MAATLDRVHSRRGFLKGIAGILAAGVAPAFVGSSVLMPVRKIFTETPRILAPHRHVFTTSGTYTVPHGATRIWVSFLGGGYDGLLTAAPGDSLDIHASRERIVIVDAFP